MGPEVLILIIFPLCMGMIAFMFYHAGSEHMELKYRRDLLKRDLALYDSQTGKWRYKEPGE